MRLASLSAASGTLDVFLRLTCRPRLPCSVSVFCIHADVEKDIRSKLGGQVARVVVGCAERLGAAFVRTIKLVDFPEPRAQECGEYGVTLPEMLYLKQCVAPLCRHTKDVVDWSGGKGVIATPSLP